jgi:hypothetical protein
VRRRDYRQTPGSHQVWETYEDIVNACCNAWNDLMRAPEIIRSIATRDWAQVST